MMQRNVWRCIRRDSGNWAEIKDSLDVVERMDEDAAAKMI